MNKTIFVVALLVSILAVSQHISATEISTSEKAFSLKETKNLSLHWVHANVEMVDADNKELIVTMKQTLKRGKPQHCLHKLEFSRKGDSLKVFNKSQTNTLKSRCSVERTIHIKIDPQSLSNFIFSHKHGVLNIESLVAINIQLEVGHSSLDVGVIRASNSKLSVEHTDSTINNMDSKTSKTKGAHGELVFRHIQGQEVEIDWAHGGIQLDGIASDYVKIHQRHGKLEINNHQGQNLNLSNAHGPINAQTEKAERVVIRNRHGSIKFAGSSVSLETNNKHGSTNIKQTSPDYAIVRANSAHGNIDLHIHEGSACDIQGASNTSVSHKMFREGESCLGEPKHGNITLTSKHGKARVYSF